MKNAITIILLTLVSVISANAQYGNFRKYQVAETGHYCYFPADPGKFEEQKSEDGQLMYLAEANVNDNTFGIITVILNESFSNYSSGELKELLISYLEYLKQSFEITDTVGYGLGHTLNSNPDAQGILDYWKNKDEKEMVVKGWISKQAIVFLYIKGKELPNQNVQSLFLNGFVFKK